MDVTNTHFIHSICGVLLAAPLKDLHPRQSNVYAGDEVDDETEECSGRDESHATVAFTGNWYQSNNT